MSFKCEPCNKEFNSEDALAQHKSSKHGSVQKTKYIAYGIIGAVVIIAIVYFAFMRGPSENGKAGNFASDDFVLNTNVQHTGLSMHIHPEIEIVINGEQQLMPANIGVNGYKMSVIHTHDASGTLHVESPVRKDFTVRQFFLLWSQSSRQDKVFNSTCILDYCNDGEKTVKMSLNGQPNSEFENLVMGDGDKIRIEYS